MSRRPRTLALKRFFKGQKSGFSWGTSIATILGSEVISAIVAGIFSFYGEQEKAKEGRAQALELEQRKTSYEVLKDIWSNSDPKRRTDLEVLAGPMAGLLPNDAKKSLQALSDMCERNLTGSRTSKGNDPFLDGNGTHLIVETRSLMTKDHKAFPMLCALAVLGFDFCEKHGRLDVQKTLNEDEQDEPRRDQSRPREGQVNSQEYAQPAQTVQARGISDLRRDA